MTLPKHPKYEKPLDANGVLLAIGDTVKNAPSEKIHAYKGVVVALNGRAKKGHHSAVTDFVKKATGNLIVVDVIEGEEVGRCIRSAAFLWEKT